MADLTGQPYPPVDRATADAVATVPGIELAVHDCRLDDVPDIAVRPLAQLVALARKANEYCDETSYALAGQDFGAVLTELHTYAVVGDSDTRRAALAALVEACIAASGTVRTLGHGTLAAALAERGEQAARRPQTPPPMYPRPVPQRRSRLERRWPPTPQRAMTAPGRWGVIPQPPSGTEPPSDRRRIVIHASCSVHQVARGFTNLVVRKINGEIEFDPHVDGSCKITMDEDEGCVLRDALTEWLG